MPAAFSAASKTTLHWNSSLARPELVALDASGKYIKQMFNLKGCYYPPTPIAQPTQNTRLTSTPVPTKVLPTITGKPPPLTKEGKFDFQADLSRWPRIAAPADLTRYVEYVKNYLSRPWGKSVCTYPMIPYDQPNRKQLIYFDYPVCLCSQELPIKKIAGFVIEKTGYNAMYGIISQVWTPSGTRFYTAIADLNGGALATSEKRELLTTGESYMSVFGDYLKTPGDNMPQPSLGESPMIFMLAEGWIKLDEYNKAFRQWADTSVPPNYFEAHPAAGEITRFFIQWQ